MPAAYLIYIDPSAGYRDHDAMARYATHVGATVEAFGGKYHARHRRIHVLEGQWVQEFLTLIEFPSTEALQRFYRSEECFYRSEEYRPWLELRKTASDGDMLMVGE